MGVVPTKDIEAIQFFQNHVTIWTNQPQTIGLTAAEVSDLGKAANDANRANTAAANARQGSKSATQDLKNAIKALRTRGAAAISAIKAFAETSANPSVYTIAQIPPPAARTPALPPTQPTDFSVTIVPERGGLTLKWKSKNPNGGGGAIYEIARKLPGDASFTLIGSTGQKNFTDDTIPAGTASVSYVVTPKRARTVGTPSLPLTIAFGVGGPGMSISLGDRVKLAA